MRRLSGLALALWTLQGLAAAHAAGGFTCAKSRCEAKSRACVEALYVSHAACMKAGNASCASVPPADKFNCLRGALSPCGQTRNTAQDACLADVRVCHAACGPHDGKRVHYWCVGSLDNMTLAAFCEADKGATSHSQNCSKALSPSAAAAVSMTCESL